MGVRNKMFATVATIAAVAAMSTAAQAASTTINFSDYSNTFLASADGVSFSLDSGYAVNGLGTTPYVNAFGDGDEIANSANYGAYPTSDTLTFTFSVPVQGVSLNFNNYGFSGSGRGASFYTAYGSSDNVISTGFLGYCYTCVATVSGSGITSLVLDNNTGDPTGDSDSWLFGVDSISFSAVPEPTTWALMLSGFGLLGGMLRRRSAAAVA